jgi:hypothetical protein
MALWGWWSNNSDDISSYVEAKQWADKLPPGAIDPSILTSPFPAYIQEFLADKAKVATESDVDFTLIAEGFLLPFGLTVTDHVLEDLVKRGWTLSGISEAYSTPFYVTETTNLYNGNPAKVYYRSSISGDYVVIDDVTMEAIAIGDCYNPYWSPEYPPMRNPIWGMGYQLPPGYYGPDMYGNWPW